VGLVLEVAVVGVFGSASDEDLLASVLPVGLGLGRLEAVYIFFGGLGLGTEGRSCLGLAPTSVEPFVCEDKDFGFCPGLDIEGRRCWGCGV
jgi:hypothetical protein